ncbi:copper chaperone PCu(A)C [Pseudaminobacter soli (ex Zhang et al. 2022)]
MFRRTAAALAALIALMAPSVAHEFKAGMIEIGHPWSRPTPPSAPVASGYMTLTNSGAEADRLVEISSPLSERAEIHRSAIESGVASMRPVEGLPLEPGTTVDFAAEKLHVMFIGPERQLKDGERFPATLVFEKAGAVEVEFVVQRRADEAAPEDHSGHGGSN